MVPPLMSVRDLTMRFRTDEGLVTAVDRISFDFAPGEVLGLVGESGSGKSVTAKALMKLNPGNAIYPPESRILLVQDGRETDVLALRSARELMLVRGGAGSMIFHEPMASFAPAITIGDHMIERLLLHTEMTKRQARAHAVDMLARVGVADPGRRIDQYAFEFSGGHASQPQSGVSPMPAIAALKTEAEALAASVAAAGGLGLDIAYADVFDHCENAPEVSGRRDTSPSHRPAAHRSLA